jgi:acetyl/propionyl-CoA carboxylase alpha subunit
MGLASVAVYSECDRAGRYVQMADEACAIGPSEHAEGYLRIDRLLDAARHTHASSVHPWVRDDSGVEAGGEVPIYDAPMVSKLAVWGPDRARALARRRRALREYDVLGIKTTVPFSFTGGWTSRRLSVRYSTQAIWRKSCRHGRVSPFSRPGNPRRMSHRRRQCWLASRAGSNARADREGTCEGRTRGGCPPGSRRG